MKSFLSITLLSLLPIVIYGQWTQSIQLKAHSVGSQLTDFQVLVELNDTTFDFNSSNLTGSDIRFSMSDTYSGSGELSHWTEEYEFGDELKIWVKIPDIPATGDTVFYLHYGNSSATDISDGEATFDFFDHFDGSSLDTTKWKEFGYGSISLQDSYIRLLQSSGNWDKGVITDDIKNMSSYKIKSRFRLMDSVSNFNIQHGITDEEGIWHLKSGNNHEFIRAWNRVYVGQINSSGTNRGDVGSKFTYQLNEWYKGEAWFSGTEKWSILDTVVAYSDSNTHNNDWMGIAVFSWNNHTPRVDVDWIFVRKFHDPDVGVDVVEDPVGIYNQGSVRQIRIYPNPSNGYISIANLDEDKTMISIMNQYGQLVVQEEISNLSEVTLDIPSQFRSGLYFIHIESNQYNYTQRLILSR